MMGQGRLELRVLKLHQEQAVVLSGPPKETPCFVYPVLIQWINSNNYEYGHMPVHVHVELDHVGGATVTWP